MSKHKNARIFAAVLAAGSFLCFQPSLIKAETTSEAENQQNIQGEEELPTLQDHRNALANSNYICEIVFLGYLGEHSGKLSEDRTFLNQFLDDSGYMDAFSFVKDLPDEQIVEIENGHELYCIFPVDPNASVAVNEYLINESNGFYGETGDVLYKSETGEPILLRCNVSDIIRDSEVNIVDSQGRVLTWQFGISLKDGSVICPVTEPYAFDASYLNVSEESYAYDGNGMEYQGTESDCGDYNWAEEEPDLPLTGSLSYMIDGFGNMFLKGKYDVDVIKITMDGIVAN